MHFYEQNIYWETSEMFLKHPQSCMGLNMQRQVLLTVASPMNQQISTGFDLVDCFRPHQPYIKMTSASPANQKGFVSNLAKCSNGHFTNLSFKIMHKL
jgi:hypothetical protein